MARDCGPSVNPGQDFYPSLCSCFRSLPLKNLRRSETSGYREPTPPVSPSRPDRSPAGLRADGPSARVHGPGVVGRLPPVRVQTASPGQFEFAAWLWGKHGGDPFVRASSDSTCRVERGPRVQLCYSGAAGMPVLRPAGACWFIKK